MAAIHDILAVSVLITQMQGGQPVGTATGFFYESGGNVYLVTNRHVVIDEKANVRPDSLRLRLHVSPDDTTKNVDFDVPLYKNENAMWHVHPTYPKPPIDVAVVTVDQAALKKDHFFKVLSSATFLPEKLVIVPGEDVMVIGFPRGVSDVQNNLPLIRNTMIASAYGVPFQGQPMFLIDANLHPGTSGSPVVTKPKNAWQDTDGNLGFYTGTPMYLLGVHSATLSVKVQGADEALGLGAVWYAAVIQEIIDSIPKKAG